MRTTASRIAGEWSVLAALAILPWACAPKLAQNETAANAVGIRENAQVRFVNATTSVESVDLYRDETRVLAEVGKDEVSDYNDWLAERHDIELRIPGSVKPIAANTEVLSAGQRYTVVGYNKTDGTSGVAFFRENVSKPESGKARLRLIHVADGADELEVFPTGAHAPLVGRVNYKTDISAEIDPDIKSLEIRKEGGRIVSVRIQHLSLHPGKSYTIIVAADADHKLRAIQIENASPTREAYLQR